MYFKRDRLNAKIAKLLNRYPSLLIAAPAGYGKTALINDFIGDKCAIVISLEPQDNELITFCSRLLSQIQKIHLDFGSSFEKLLQSYTFEKCDQQFIRLLANELVEDLQSLTIATGDSILLVLDNFQFVTDSYISQFIGQLIKWLPIGYHLILSTRKLPNDSIFVILKTKQYIVEINANDLAFDVDEIRGLLGQFYGITNPQSVETLANYSEGWITAILLVLKNNGGLNEKCPTDFENTEIFAYLNREVFANLTINMQEFLLKTAILQKFTIDTCATFLNSDVLLNKTMIIELELNNLFIFRSYQNGQNYFEYHRLFRQFLYLKLKQNNQILEQLYLRVVSIFKDASECIEAIKYYNELGETTLAANIFNHNVKLLYASIHKSTLIELLNNISAQILDTLPNLLLLQAQLLLEFGDNEASLSILTRAENLYNDGQLLELIVVRSEQALALFGLGRHSQAIEIAESILEKESNLLSNTEGIYAQAKALQVLGQVSVLSGDVSGAEAKLLRVVEIYSFQNDNFHVACAEELIGDFYQTIGQLVSAYHRYRHALAYFCRISNNSREVELRLKLTQNLYLQKQYYRVIEELGVSFADAEPRVQMLYLTLLGKANREVGNHDEATKNFNLALVLAKKNGLNELLPTVFTEFARLYLLRRNWTAAKSSAHWGKYWSERNGSLPSLAENQLVRAWLEFEENQYERAMALATDAIKNFQHHDQINQMRATWALAVFHFKMKQSPQNLKRTIKLVEACLELQKAHQYQTLLDYELDKAQTLLVYAQSINLDISPLKLKKQELNTFRVLAFKGGKVFRDNLEVKNWRRVKAKELFFFLLENNGISDRDKIIDSLWPESEIANEKVKPNTDLNDLFYQTVFCMRKAIAPIQLEYSNGCYLLDTSQVSIWYDAAEFERIFQTSEITTEHLKQALNLYQEEDSYLACFDADWCISKRNFYQSLRGSFNFSMRS